MGKATGYEGTTRLTKAEQRYFDFIQACLKEGRNPTIGEVCKACKTTPWTLLKKIRPGLMAKMALDGGPVFDQLTAAGA